MLSKLKQLGIEQNTLVVFAPDHGSNSKASLFSHDGTRIPMIAWWPGRIPGGNAAPSGQVDTQIAQVKQLTVQGKNVMVPKKAAPANSASPPAESKKELHKKKKAAK